jgi:hypothetical protein
MPTGITNSWRSLFCRIRFSAIARHGYYSRQANEERRELNRLYERCGRRDRDGDRDRDGYRNYYHDRD